MAILKKVSKILREYCENTSLVGPGYISNQRIHISERIFWFILMVISTGGSYYLIREYQKGFESNSISLVVEGTGPRDVTYFPAVAICESAKTRLITSSKVTEFVKELGKPHGETAAKDDIVKFLNSIIFKSLYSPSIDYWCETHFECGNCSSCPTSGYKEIAEQILLNCSQLINNCRWNGDLFNCCDYFLPLQTPIGRCFFLNSEQTTTRNGPHWLKTETSWNVGIGELQFETTQYLDLYILNAEDLPTHFIKNNFFEIWRTEIEIHLNVKKIINDPDIHEISPEYRRCRFPDENIEDSGYKYYSFTVCLADCMKQIQIENCGSDMSPLCDYAGFICLDKLDLIFPPSSILQPWRSSNPCTKCLPSCNEHEINLAGDFGLSEEDNEGKISQVKIIQSVGTEQYHRQSVRTSLDVVVTIGGILGLFLGASIISGIEILYFFCVRIFN